MPQLDFSVSSDVVRTPRVMQVEALFDAPAEEKLTREWHMTVPLEEQPWQIGLIVGPSGSGKSTTARHMFGDLATITHEWSPTGVPASRRQIDSGGSLRLLRALVSSDSREPASRNPRRERS